MKRETRVLVIFFAREARWCDNIQQMYIFMYIHTHTTLKRVLPI